MSTARTGRLLLLSPHLDDAVFACGEVIASTRDATVATVFAGRPRRARATSWDARAGFGPGDDVVGARRDEDRHALDVLGATPMWLDYCDDQYGRGDDLEVVRSIADLLAMQRFDTILFPLGLFHKDHRSASDAALGAMRGGSPPRWIVYEDALYRRIPQLVDERIAELKRRRFLLSRVALPIDRADASRKPRAVACYRSQLRALATPGRLGHRDAFAPERYWSIERGS